MAKVFGFGNRNSSGDPEEFRATLVEHLEELRNRIVRSVIALAVGWLIGWLVEPFFFKQFDAMSTKAILSHLPKGSDYKPIITHVAEAFLLKLKLGFCLGLLLSIPYIVVQIWGFIAPGLKESERKPFTRLVPFSVGLFAMGVFFCWMILPFALGWFADFLVDLPGVALYQDPEILLILCVKLLLAFGIGFQLPLVVWVLGALNLLSAETLLKYWRQGATGIFVISAIVTPSNDAISMLMMAIPLTILFIISVYLVKFTQRKQQRLRAEEEAKERAAYAYKAPPVEPEPQSSEPVEETPEAKPEE